MEDFKFLKRLRVRAPVFLVFTLLVILGSARSVRAETTLTTDMTHFVRINDKDAIEAYGRTLNQLFDFKGKDLPDDRQYLAYYQIDKKKESSLCWYTYKEYWHKKPYNDLKVPDADHVGKSTNVFLQVKVDGSGKKVNGVGKKTFTAYATKLANKKHKTKVDSDMVGTLHYFCIDPDTTTGKKFAEIMDKDTGLVTFYISPVIRTRGYKTNSTFYNEKSWYNHGWSDRNEQHYISHYNHKFVFKLKSVKVTSTATLVGARRKSSSVFKVQDRLKDNTTSFLNLRDIDTSALDGSSAEIQNLYSVVGEAVVEQNEETGMFSKTEEQAGQTTNDTSEDELLKDDFIYAWTTKEVDGENVRDALKMKDSVKSRKSKDNPTGKTKYKTNPVVKEIPFSTDGKMSSYKLQSPLYEKGSNTISYGKNGKKTAALVGYTIYKYVKVKDPETNKMTKKRVYLANCMIELRKDSTKQYVPYARWCERSKLSHDSEKVSPTRLQSCFMSGLRDSPDISGKSLCWCRCQHIRWQRVLPHSSQESFC